MKPSEILYLNHVSYIGGAEISLLDLVRHLDRTRYEPVVLVPPGDLMDELGRLDVRCVPIPVLPGLNRYTLPVFLRRVPLLLSRIRTERPALIHANTNFTSCYSGLLSRLSHIPAVGLIQDMEPFGRIGRFLVRQNTRVIAISEAVRNYLHGEHVPDGNIVRIHHGVDLEKYHEKEREDVSTSPSGIIIGIVGQLGERKGHLYVLEALRDIVNTSPQVTLWIVGKEPEHSTEGYTQRLTEFVNANHLEKHVKFWGFRSDIPDVLAQSDVLILSSLQEPFGKIVVEAMAMGKPVIASRVGGVPEIVRDGETGFLVPPQDSQAIRQALEQFIRNPEKLKLMGNAGRKRVEQHFSIERTVRSTEQLYEQLLFDKQD